MKKNLLFTILFSILIITACNDDEILDQPTVTYYPSLSSIVDEPSEGQQEVITVTLELSASIANVSSAVISIESSDAAYDAGFSTLPEAVNNEIFIEFGENERFASFDIIVENDVELNPSDVINFRISGFTGGIKSIGQSTFVLRIGDLDAGGCNDFSSGTIVRSYNFDSCPEFDSPDGFSQYFIDGFKDDRGWQCRRFGEGGTPGIQASAFGGSAGEDNAWLILNEPFNMNELGNLLVQFSVESFFGGPGTMDLVYSSTYPGTGQPDQDGVSWFRMGDVRDQLPPAGSGGFNQILSSPCIVEGEAVYFGFHFYGAESSGSSSWSIDNLSFMLDDGLSGTISENFEVPFSDDLNACSDFSLPSNFTQQLISGSKQDRGWACAGNGVGNTQSISANAIGGVTGAVDAWLISAKPFDLSGLSEATLSFDAKSSVDGLGDLKILTSANYEGDGSPDAASWTEMTGFTLPPGGSNSIQEVSVDLSSVTGEVVYLAFQYVGATNASAIAYDLDNIAITSDSGSGGGGGGSGAFDTDEGNCDITGSGTVIVSHDFEGCSDDFSTPSGFIEAFGPGSKTDRGWGCRDDGTDGSRGVRASAFGGEEGFDDAWLIMDPVDLTSFSEVSLAFDVQSPFDGPGDLVVLYSSNYGGSGDPTTADWTELANVDDQLPAAGSGDTAFENVVTSPCDVEGSNVYFAFRYVDGTSGASSAWSIDNLVLSGN